jgi:catalase
MSTLRRKAGASAKPNNAKPSSDTLDKLSQLEHAWQDPGPQLTTAQGLPISDNHNALKAGERGPLLLEDFVLREKLAHFAHERIPERVVNARGAGAHGMFRLYKPLSEYTTAAFLQNPEQQTPVFVRFSNGMGSRGGADTVRDQRGFAVKFYTSEGNFDLLGSSLPVFYIQDPIKYPDLVHAMRPEPQHGMPQASTAHDTFWDFASLMPETTHMLMWLMSDRALPRSWRMMEGHGVHSFALINGRGQSHWVKFHWRPILGVQNLMAQEAVQIAGRDPDFHRRDLWQAIEQGHFPEWELGLQAVPAGREDELGLDWLDPTKLIPQELLPILPVGRLVLNRNPDNFFAEVEQAAFHPGHVVPGMDFTNDALLQGRLLAYTHAQLHRLGGPNFHALPINRPLCAVHHFQRDGQHQGAIHRGSAAYEPNTLAQGAEMRVDGSTQGFQTQSQETGVGAGAAKQRQRSARFDDHFSQATLFWNSQTSVSKEHIVAAFRGELGQVQSLDIRQRVVDNLAHVDPKLAARVAQPLGLRPPDASAAAGRLGFRAAPSPTPKGSGSLQEAPSLSQGTRPRAEGHAATSTRRVAVLVADGVDAVPLRRLLQELEEVGLVHQIIAPHLGSVATATGRTLAVDLCLGHTASVFFDALVVAGGAVSVQALIQNGAALHFVLEAYKHNKSICALNEGAQLLASLGLSLQPERGCALNIPTPGVILADGHKAQEAEISSELIAAITLGRHWDRLNVDAVPA